MVDEPSSDLHGESALVTRFGFTQCVDDGPTHDTATEIRSTVTACH